MKLQVVSDLHLETNKSFHGMIIPRAQILCLAGDICACGEQKYFDLFNDFIEYYSRAFKYIIHVAGNHEYYSDYYNNLHTQEWTMGNIKKKLKFMRRKYKNYIFLDNDGITFKNEAGKNYTILGTTLWSAIPQDMYRSVLFSMQDYKKIFTVNSDGKIITLNPEDTVRLHEKAVIFLKKNIKKFSGTNIILLTHHKPISWCHPKYEGKPTNCCYQTDLEYLIKFPVVAAIFGHTHEKCDKIINNVRVVSNPYGFSNERDITRYKSNFVIQV